jgi:hypothetical protein
VVQRRECFSVIGVWRGVRLDGLELEHMWFWSMAFSNGELVSFRYGVGNWGVVRERGWTLFKYDRMVDTIGKIGTN